MQIDIGQTAESIQGTPNGAHDTESELGPRLGHVGHQPFIEPLED